MFTLGYNIPSLSLIFFQPHTHVLKPKVDPGSEEYVLELSLAEQKLVSLAEELSSRDLDTIHKEMADEEVCRIGIV